MEVTPGVDPLSFMRRIGRLYRLMHATVQPSLEQRLNLQPKEVQVLAAVTAGHTSPTQISARIGIPPPSTSRLVDRLVAAELIERTTDPTDLRRFHLQLTPAGVTALADARQLARAALDVLFENVPAEDILRADTALSDLETRFGRQES